MERGGFAYITSTKMNTVLYTGSTSDLVARIDQHKSKEYPNSFTAKYNVDKLVYYEYFQFIEEAILREKQIKSWKRNKKEKLIGDFNPGWKELYFELDDWD
ncbi:MAG TPA: GIY-YIG nuclease family protein [Bacteroidales bacterium]|jgi:putative endonuclease|nr:excinuclease ABC subunit C [Bacteroidota bacterium]HJN05242.1 GIY-YIG nuclease family protein [Bacteroidales bacterium]|tara:strand:- start:147 stop:449 length:303 start_codon:yes stop_codon:yes gene_type:complete